MTYQSISQWLGTRLAEMVNISIDQVDTQLQFDRYGLDSLNAVTLIGELSDWLEIELDPSIIYDHPSIEELSNYILQKIQGGDE